MYGYCYVDCNGTTGKITHVDSLEKDGEAIIVYDCVDITSNAPSPSQVSARKTVGIGRFVGIYSSIRLGAEEQDGRNCNE